MAPPPAPPHAAPSSPPSPLSRVLQPKRAPANSGEAGIQGAKPFAHLSSWKKLDAWLTPCADPALEAARDPRARPPHASTPRTGGARGAASS
jgi:hypothetical protein